MDRLEKAQAEYQRFAQSFDSIIIGTVSDENRPNASYAPFIMDELKNFYIYVSSLSTHTQNLHRNPRASVLLIEDEAKSKQIFARRRLTFDCTATLLERDSPSWNRMADRFQSRFGETIELLRSLPDFRIFQLTPYAGRFVAGFGEIYQVNSSDLNRLEDC